MNQLILLRILTLSWLFNKVSGCLKNRLSILVLLLGSMPFWTGCEPQGPETIEDFDVVVTNHDSSFNFSSLKSYYLLDSVVHITASQQSSPPLDRSLDYEILNQIASELNALGYSRLDSVSANQRPDVLVTVSALANTNTNYYYDNWSNYWNWWNGWDTWYPSYSSAYYPYWGYPVTYSYSYTVGTLLIEMSIPQELTSERRFPLVWQASLNGLLTSNAANTQARMSSGIRQAFAQSPYLRATQ
jgi:hypothetical protein